MADQKISELTAITGANSADDDVYVVVDTSTGETKKITRAELFKNTPALDVTGTATMDGLTVEDGDGGTVRLSSSSTAVGLNSSIGNIEFYSNDISTGGTGVKGEIETFSHLSGGTDYSMIFRTGLVTGGANVLRDRLLIGAGGDISFYEDTGTTAKFFWDASAESLGIGTSSPSAKVHIASTSPNIYLTDTDASNARNIIDNSGGVLRFFADHDNVVASSAITFSVDSTERMRITSAGDVGIGTSSPDKKLHVNGDVKVGVAGANTGIRITADDNREGYLIFGDAADESMGGIVYDNVTDSLQFDANNAERLRIDSSGNLLVGTTDTNIASSSTEAGHNLGATGLVAASRAGGEAARFNRNSNDGDIVQFRRSGTTVGSIGVTSGDRLYIGDNNNCAIHFDSTLIRPSTSTGANNDAAIDLGSSGTRFKDLYLSGGVYLGGTGAANYLEDYEEGTWTPTISSGTHTYSQQDGWYCKVGNVVHCYAQIKITSRGSSTTELGIGGLPFSETGDNTQSCPFGINNAYGTSQLLNTSNETPTCVSVESSIAYIRNWKSINNSYTVNSLNSSGSMSISFTYLVNA